MREAVIVEAVRTPVGKRNGGLSGVHAADLSAVVLGALVDRTGLDPSTVDDVVWGCVSQVGDQSSNIGRFAVLAAGWPESIPGTTVNRACGSSQQALDFAAQAVMSGQQDVVVAGGVEVMSRVPLGSARATGMPYGPKVLARYDDFSFNQGISAEMIAEKWGLVADPSRRVLGALARTRCGGSGPRRLRRPDRRGAHRRRRGHRRRGDPAGDHRREARRAQARLHRGRGDPCRETPRRSPTARRPCWSPPRNMLRPKGGRRSPGYVAGAVAGANPVLMLTGPIPATQKVLGKTGLGIGDIGVYEVNEAFAPVPLAWLADTGADADRLNPLGGAIALGHPLGGSGAVLMTRMLHHMRDNDIRYGLQTMCEGGGTANATIVELIN